jgi:hypothetical protein
MPDLQKANDGQLPVAFTKRTTTRKAYLAKYQTGLSVEQVAARDREQGREGDVRWSGRAAKLPAPNGVVTRRRRTRRRCATRARRFSRSARREGYGIDALIGPTTPAVAATQGPEASSLPTFLLFIRTRIPAATIPGLTIPAGLIRRPAGRHRARWTAGSDQRLPAIGLAIERVLGRRRRPGVSREVDDDGSRTSAQDPRTSLVVGGPLFQLWRRLFLSGPALELLVRRMIGIPDRLAAVALLSGYQATPSDMLSLFRSCGPEAMPDISWPFPSCWPVRGASTIRVMVGQS